MHFELPSVYDISYIYAFSRRFYPKRLTVHLGYTYFISMCVPWESNPQPFALLTQCSTTEPQEHTVTEIVKLLSEVKAASWSCEPDSKPCCSDEGLCVFVCVRWSAVSTGQTTLRSTETSRWRWSRRSFCPSTSSERLRWRRWGDALHIINPQNTISSVWPGTDT